MKKSLTSALALLALSGMAGIANAQIFPFTASTSVTASPTVATSTTVLGASTTASTVTPAVPTLVTITMPASGYIQFNNLVVSNISSVTAPSTIAAGNEPGGGTNMLGMGTCMAFATQSSPAGTSVTCPVPTVMASSTAMSTGTASTTSGTSTTITTTASTYAPYQIEIDPTTQILLSDRTTGSLANITPGDQINVFGYYNVNGDGSIQASIIRDLSKPASPSGLLPVTTPLPAGSSTVVTTPTTTVTGTLSIAQIITEIQQIEQAIAQLSALIASTTTSSTVGMNVNASTTNVGTTTTSTAAPMIPAPTSTATTTNY